MTYPGVRPRSRTSTGYVCWPRPDIAANLSPSPFTPRPVIPPEQGLKDHDRVDIHASSPASHGRAAPAHLPAVFRTARRVQPHRLAGIIVGILIA